MSVRVQDFIIFVNDLSDIDETSHECVFRTYINRSYYAIFHYLKSHIDNHLPHYDLSDTGTYKTGTHNRIYWVLEDLSKTNKSAKKLAMQFRDFLDKRHKADYNLTATVTYYDVMQCQKYLANMPKLIDELK